MDAVSALSSGHAAKPAQSEQTVQRPPESTAMFDGMTDAQLQPYVRAGNTLAQQVATRRASAAKAAWDEEAKRYSAGLDQGY